MTDCSDDDRSYANEIDKLIRANDVTGVQDYLQTHPDIEKWWLVGPDSYDDTNAISLAARVGSLEVLQVLMAAAGDVDWASPLYTACSCCQVRVARWLLDTSKDAAAELRKKYGGSRDTLLLAALDGGCPTTYEGRLRVGVAESVSRPRQEEMVHLLLDRGADVQDKWFIFPHKVQPLDNTCEEENAGESWDNASDDYPWEIPKFETFTSTECFQDFPNPFPLPHLPYEKPIDKPVLMATALTSSLSFGSEHLISRFIDGGCDIHAKVRQWGDNELLDVNVDDVTPLHIACCSKNIAGVRLLLQSGGREAKAMVASQDSWGMTPFHWTTFDALAFYYKGYPWSETGMTRLEKTQACLELLLDCDPTHLDAQDFWGNTALHYATMLQSTDLIELLLSRGADPNRKNTADGQPPFFNWLAPQSLDLFVRYGARLDEADARGDTLLHIASRNWRWRDVLRQLLARGLRSDRPNGKQQVPLHIAAICLGGCDDGSGAGGFHDALRAQDDMMRMLQQQDNGGAVGGDGDDVDMMEVPDEAGVTPRQALAAGRAKAVKIAAQQAQYAAEKERREAEEWEGGNVALDVGSG